MKKKTLLIVIIVLIVLLILAGGAFAYIYYGTDLLKSDKELFAKYFTQMGDTENGIFPAAFKEYVNKRESSPYTDNGSFTVNTEIQADTSTDQTAQQMASLVNYGNNTNITFSGKVDSTNNKVEQDIAINYSDSVNLPFTYKQVGDVYGIQSDILSPSYISVENNNLQALFQKLGVTDVTGIPNKIEPQVIESLEFTDEELAHISEQYIAPMYEGLAEEKFSKVENSDGSVRYVLTLTNAELKDLFVNMLQTLSTDTMMINKINSILTEIYSLESIEGSQSENITITAADIQELINSLNSSEITETFNFEIGVTQNNGRTNKIDLSAEGLTIEFVAEQTSSSVAYTFNVNATDITDGNTSGMAELMNFSIEMSYEGINTNNVTETFNVIINMPDSFSTTYSFDNTLNFGAPVEIADFDTTNNLKINDLSAEQIESLVTQMAYIITQTNATQMTQIGFPADFGNPMVMWIAGPILNSYIYNSSSSTIAQSDDLTSEEVKASNETFEVYKGEIRGSAVRSLCMTVRNHNSLSPSNEQINVKLGEEASSTSFVTNINDINQIRNSIQSGTTYNVTFSYDAATNYICEIGIVAIN